MAKKKKNKKQEKPKVRDVKDLKPDTELYEKTIETLKEIYKEGKYAWTDPDEEVFEGIATTAPGISASTYGEITMTGVSTILAKFQSAFHDPNAVFYDLGCGLGRMVNQVALLSNVKRSVGVELCPNRLAAARNLAESLSFPAAQPEFLEGDFLEQDYSDATIVYIDNTMYNQEVTTKLLSILPPDCIFIYQSGWMSDHVPSFPVETTYNQAYGKKEGHDRLFNYLSTHCAWRPVKGFEF